MKPKSTESRAAKAIRDAISKSKAKPLKAKLRTKPKPKSSIKSKSKEKKTESEKNKALSMKLEKLKEKMRLELKEEMKAKFETMKIELNNDNAVNNKIQKPTNRFQTPPYTLTDQILYRGWFTRLRCELEAYNLLDVIDHKAAVEGLTEPLKIIEKLASHREAKTVAGEYASYRELHTTKYLPHMNIHDFLMQINNLMLKVEEYEKAKTPEDKWIPWPDARKKMILFSAVANSIPEILVIDQAQEGKLSYEAAQTILVEKAAHVNNQRLVKNFDNTSSRNPVAFTTFHRPQSRTSTFRPRFNPRQQYSNNYRPRAFYSQAAPRFQSNSRPQFRQPVKVCHSCGVSGHDPSNCPNANLQMCYYCKKMVHKNHYSANCPKRAAEQRNNSQPRKPQHQTAQQNFKPARSQANYAEVIDDYDGFAANIQDTNALVKL
ncbi:hypothetical protein U1Q18_051160 [Sarracenia purpurea var. burkii]